MRALGFGYVRSSLAIGALVVTAACSGAGSGGAPGATTGIPAVPASTLATVAPDALFTSSADLDATDIAALDVPPTSDVAPVGEARDAIEYNWNLTGSYRGLIKQWQDGVEKRGTIQFSIYNSPPKPFFGGSGTIVIGSSSNVLMQGRIVATYEHSVALEFSLTFGPNQTCSATGTARRYRHVFEGVLKSAPGSSGCAAYPNNTTYFKVHPST